MSTVFPGFIHEPSSGGVASGLTQAEEVILTLPDNDLTIGTAISIQTGVYAGGGPATVEGTATLTLPASFATDALIQVLLNGQEIKRGTDVTRTSATQVSFAEKLKKDDQIKIRIFS